MKKIIMLFILASLLFTGCSNSGAFLALNQTVVNLEEGNYVIEATNISGQSSAGYILGLSYSSGPVANSLAIARVSGTGMLYAEAIDNLWASYEAEYGTVRGEKAALTNVRYDADMLNLLLYTRVKVTVRADVILFE
ncbi:DUF6567 family protein [Rhodohalobacter sp. 8-1]|uniref:DUF6567 family protein n=1 Tax=Rhodohalobacter sp. 8-1 TaxID=3131972 RepID=UPI0030EB41F7